MVGLMRMGRVYQLSFLLAIATLPCYSGEITGTVKPSATSVRATLWYLDSEFHCACDSFMGEKNVDRAGRFRFQGLRKGRYAIGIYPVGLRCLPNTVEEVVVGDKTTDIGTVKLQPSAWVTGKVSPPGRNLTVSPDPNPQTSCRTKPDGSFEVDGLTLGKHRLSVFQDGYLVEHVEVEVTGVREYKLAPIRLVSRSSVTGTLRGKLLYARSPASQEDLDTGRVQLHVYALPVGSAPVSFGGVPRYWTDARDIAPESGDYKIVNVQPGRYDLVACGPGCVVRGVSDMPSDAVSADDSALLLKAIETLGTAFDAGDEQSVRDHSDTHCLFAQGGKYVDAGTLLEKWQADGCTPGQRRLIIARLGGGKAVVFSRAPAVWANGPQRGALEFIESWRFVREGLEWKLAEYQMESEMTEFVATLRIPIDPRDDKPTRTFDKLPHVSVIVTGDPKLAGVDIRPGEVTFGHDVDLIAR